MRAALAAVTLMAAAGAGDATPVAASQSPAIAAATSASVALDSRCYLSGATMTLRGAGFVPDAPLAILGAASVRFARSDAAGSVTATELRAPRVRTIHLQELTLRIRDVQDASTAATARAWVVRAPFDTNAPLAGNPRARTTWRFAGFASGRPIYGHFRRNGGHVRSVRFGVARGPCGTLVVRERRVPVASPDAGMWSLKLDQRPRYLPGMAGRMIRFRLIAG